MTKHKRIKKIVCAGMVCILLGMFSGSVQAQKEGLIYYRQHKYALAQQSLGGWYKTDSNTNNIEALTSLGDCYWINRNYKAAFNIYEKIKTSVTGEKGKEIVKRLSDIEAMKGEYAKAATELNGMERFSQKKKGFEHYTEYLKDSGNWNIGYLELNTLATECIPYVNDSVFIITTDRETTVDNYRTNNYFSELQYLRGKLKINEDADEDYKHGNFEKFNEVNDVIYNRKLAILHENADVPLLKKYNYPNSNYLFDYNVQRLNNLNIKPKFMYNTGSISMQPKGDTTTAYFVADDNSSKAVKSYTRYDTVEVPAFIFKGSLVQEDNTYRIKNAVKMNMEGFDGQIAQATVSRDGKAVVFSGRTGERKDYNLYCATRLSENKWGNVTELGKNINTYGDEAFPQLQDDGTLFFSSDGLPGLGALDVFCIPGFYGEGNIKTNGNPVHLSYPVNTAFDDYGVYVTHQPEDGKYEDLNNMEGYFTSNRVGTDDIFYFNYKRRLFNCNGRVYGRLQHGGSQWLEGATVKIYADNKELDKAVTDKYGNYSFTVEPHHDYEIRAEKEGWIPSGVKTTTQTIPSDFPNIFLERKNENNNENPPYIEKNEEVVKTFIIHHEFDKTTIVKEDKELINDITEYYGSHPNSTVKIYSTCDCYGSEQHNTVLARNRSIYIKNNLVRKGINRIVDINSAAKGKRMIPCPEVRNEENIRRQEANRYTTVYITIKKQ